MAKCNFLGGLKGVRGTLCKKVTYDHGKKVVTRVVASVRGGKQRIYIREQKERTTKIKPREIEVRNMFSKAQAEISAMSEERKLEFQKQWKENSYSFNGKLYKTLRGYMMARLYAEMSDGVDLG